MKHCSSALDWPGRRYPAERRKVNHSGDLHPGDLTCRATHFLLAEGRSRHRPLGTTSARTRDTWELDETSTRAPWPELEAEAIHRHSRQSIYPSRNSGRNPPCRPQLCHRQSCHRQYSRSWRPSSRVCADGVRGMTTRNGRQSLCGRSSPNEQTPKPPAGPRINSRGSCGFAIGFSSSANG